MSGFLAGLGVDIYPLLSTFQTHSEVALYSFPLGFVFLSFVDRLLGDREDEADAENDAGVTADDDLFDADPDLGELDDFGDLGTDDAFSDEFEDERSDVAELEPRIDELETEIDSITSTVSTVRSENQAISDTVEEVEENVRKLLDIYEMVTRGVNPFVDDVRGGSAETDTFGLFGGDEESTDGETTVDEEVLGADPEAFFDDDFDEGEFDDDGDAVVDEFDGSDLDEKATDVDGDSEFEGEGIGGKTFDDLKAEYDSGDGGWDDGEDDGPFDDDEFEDTDVGFEFDQVDGKASQSSAGETVDEAAQDNIGDTDENFESAPGSVSGAGDSDFDAFGTGPGEFDATGGGSTPSNGDQPYLTRIPEGYSFELIVLEWMEYLLNNTDTAGALRAIDYYRNIDWINDRVANDLTEIIRGFDANGSGSKGGHTVSELSVDHHSHSLEFISQLDGRGIDVGLMTNRSARGK